MRLSINYLIMKIIRRLTNEAQIWDKLNQRHQLINPLFSYGKGRQRGRGFCTNDFTKGKKNIQVVVPYLGVLFGPPGTLERACWHSSFLRLQVMKGHLNYSYSSDKSGRVPEKSLITWQISTASKDR